jgi:hypothetical protein
MPADLRVLVLTYMNGLSRCWSTKIATRQIPNTLRRPRHHFAGWWEMNRSSQEQPEFFDSVMMGSLFGVTGSFNGSTPNSSRICTKSPTVRSRVAHPPEGESAPSKHNLLQRTAPLRAALVLC